MAQMPKSDDSWQSGNPYEKFMGRWSRLIGARFLQWLPVPIESKWLDIGCGTGALSNLVLELKNPIEVWGIDSSPEFIEFAQKIASKSSLRFDIALAQSLPIKSDYFDAAISGLALNFIPQPEQAVKEMMRVTKQGGIVAAYVWDYADGMQLLRYFWDAVVDLDPNAAALDEGKRFPLCQEKNLKSLFEECGLYDINSRSIEVDTTFQDFEDYWQPFLGKVGPAPSYVMSLDEKGRKTLMEQLQASLPSVADGTINLTARAWAVQGVV